MNIHPLVVHFPIALLTLYSLLEVASLTKREWTKNLYTTKLFLLFVGTVGTFFALQSGEQAAEITGQEGSTVVQVHEQWAEITYTLYIILTVYYLLTTQYIRTFVNKLPKVLIEWIETIQNWKYIYRVISLIALLGLMSITITGALGGALTHGANADPFVAFIYSLLIGQ